MSDSSPTAVPSTTAPTPTPRPDDPPGEALSAWMRRGAAEAPRPPLPRPADPERLRLGLERWQALGRDGPEDTRAATADLVAAALADPATRALLEGVFGCSPHLSSSLLKEPQVLATLARLGPEGAFEAILTETAETLRGLDPGSDLAPLMTALRLAKRRAGLLIALADIAGVWSVDQVTAALSRLAEDTLSGALVHLLRQRAARGDLVLADPTDPEPDCGLFILGMGKLGGGELNYSSDIDLIVLFDPEKMDYRGRRSLKECVVAMTRDLVRVMEERTAQGYVFRMDLRLRPDPGSTAVALSTEAAEVYYETLGQNWERAAMIKARPVAGDRAAAQAFLAHIRPFVWRKYLDFNAIQDIHSMKRQIHAAKGGAQIGVAGHNIKLGRGGIREIEFFAQTQQLIWGGRNPHLRLARTCETLAALAEAKLITEAVRDDLTEAYGRLRVIEHRLQMIDDEQTQTLPEDPDKLRRLALFLGYPDAEAFAEALVALLRRVERHYAKLFEDAPSLSSEEGGNLVFTGGEDDPETLASLREMGFANPEAVSATVRGWHHGRYNATRSIRARERLTELIPGLLAALAATAQPDTALLRFDEVLRKLPTGVQLFTLMERNRGLLALLAEILGDAPRLAGHLARNPNLMDAVLTPFEGTPSRDDMLAELDTALLDAQVFEDSLLITRRWANDTRFRIGLMTLRGELGPEAAGHCLADLADVALVRLIPRVEEEFAHRHGTVPGGALAVLALGKLGSREMTATSDLDLIMIYDAPEEAEASDGDKPLAVTVYFTRLAQRIINAITAPTGEGELFEVDMRLRPSGNQGPLATSLTAFRRYQAEGAWTWEHQALTRARVVTGPPALAEAVSQVIRETLTHPRDAQALARDVAAMRGRMDRDKPPASRWDVKLVPGGLVDVDFIAQYLQLRHAADHPDVVVADTSQALARLAQAGLIDPDHAALLIRHHRRNLAIQATLRHSITSQPKESDLTPGLKAKLVRATEALDFPSLASDMETDAARVRVLFETLVGPVGAADQTADPAAP